jgi:hypothetical protein
VLVSVSVLGGGRRWEVRGERWKVEGGVEEVVAIVLTCVYLI